MPLTAGDRLGTYEILAPIGAGGMGEVYRARDTKLGRDVALKVLAQAFAADVERMARFRREAQVLASLNHSNIAAIYGFEDSSHVHALVMELVEGPTLADRIKIGAIPIEEALLIAKQICEGVEYAHERGIIHRDLKPANIKLANNDAVKILDFGLAKALDTDVSSTDISSSPTISRMATQAGIILGTAAYMSPEQAKGKSVDRRTDIWAFGCVVYEMLTGKMAFSGETVTDTLAAVIKSEPDWSLLPPNTPPAIRNLLVRCLKKDAKQRLQAIGDARIAIDEVVSGAPQDSSPFIPSAVPVPSTRWWIVAAAALLALAAVGGALLWLRLPQPIALDAYILPPEKTSFTLTSDDAAGPVVLSKGGKQIAFVAADDKGNDRIYVRDLDNREARLVPGTEGAEYPFWSTDGKSLGFSSSGKLRRVGVSGGPVLDICNAVRPRGGTWGADGTILFAPDATSSIFRVSASPGSTPVQVTTLDAAHTTNRWPVLLPDGKHFLYFATNHSDPRASASNGIYFASLDGRENRFVEPAESNAVFASGRLLWVLNGDLLAQAFNPSTGRTSGEAMAVAQGVGINFSTWRAAFDASDNGVLVYQPGLATGNTTLQILKRDGKLEGTLNEASRVQDFRISPDGHKAAALTGDTLPNIWILDLDKGTRVRFTFEATADGMAWSGDGRQLYYVFRGKPYRIYRQEVGGSGKKELVLESANALHVSDVSADGKYLLFAQAYGNLSLTTWVMPLAGGGQARPLVDEALAAYSARFSPDDKWVLYHTTETGHYDLYATSLLRGGKLQLTSNGAERSRWSGDGKAIYFATMDGSVFEMPVTETDDSLQPGILQLLFKGSTLSATSFFGVSWDVMRDGQRFLVNTAGQQTDGTAAVIVLNWPARLKK
jgi:serine/threonine protein kinase/sugar lactone lactonase YvrE